MQLCRSYVPATHMERALQARLCGMNKMTFTSLANTFPEYTWITLFKALNNLERQRLVKLTPVPWDYEITILSETTMKQEWVERSWKRSRSTRTEMRTRTCPAFLQRTQSIERGNDGFPTSG